MGEDLFFFFFFLLFSLFKTTKICFGSTKMEFSTKKSISRRGKKSEKMTLPLRKFFLLCPCIGGVGSRGGLDF